MNLLKKKSYWHQTFEWYIMLAIFFRLAHFSVYKFKHRLF